jgi:spermidine synthase
MIDRTASTIEETRESSRPTVVARIDTNHGEWVLRRGLEDGLPVFEVIGNGSFLMDTREAGSEEALARLALEGRPAAHVLIGGLGLGFTLRACLSFEPEAVDVAEIEPAVAEWVSGPVAEVFGDPLEDPRVRVIVGDVFDVLVAAEAAYDVVLMDTDNGPSWLVYPRTRRSTACPGSRPWPRRCDRTGRSPSGLHRRTRCSRTGCTRTSGTSTNT